MFSSFFSSFSFSIFICFYFLPAIALLFYFIVSFCHLFALLCFPVIFYLQDFPIPDMEYTIRISCQMIVMCYHDQCLLLLSDYPLATPTLCCCPPDIWFGRCFLCFPSFTRSNIALAFFILTSLGTLRKLNGNATFSTAFSVPIR